MDSIFNNPKTSLTGLAGAIGAALVAWSHGQLDAGSIGSVILAVSSLAMGLAAKDATTHSTTAQVQEATMEARK
jgi:hypothetical protein